MPGRFVVEDFLREKIAQAIAPRTNFAVGVLKDETSCLIYEDGEWVVVYDERGKFRAEARVRHDINAAKYLILLLLLLQQPGGFTFPAIGWTGYASLPDE